MKTKYFMNCLIHTISILINIYKIEKRFFQASRSVKIGLQGGYFNLGFLITQNFTPWKNMICKTYLDEIFHYYKLQGKNVGFYLKRDEEEKFLIGLGKDVFCLNDKYVDWGTSYVRGQIIKNH